MDLSAIGAFLTAKFSWVTGVVTILYCVEKLLETVGTTYNVKLVDNIGVYMGNVLKALWPVQKPVDSAPKV